MGRDLLLRFMTKTAQIKKGIESLIHNLVWLTRPVSQSTATANFKGRWIVFTKKHIVELKDEHAKFITKNIGVNKRGELWVEKDAYDVSLVFKRGETKIISKQYLQGFNLYKNGFFVGFYPKRKVDYGR